MKRPLLSRLLLLAVSVAILSNGSAQAKYEPATYDTVSSEQSDFRAYSNPSGAGVRILFNSPVSGEGYLSLYEQSGRMVSRRKVRVARGMNSWKQNLPSAGTGVYVAKLNMDTLERKTVIFKGAP